MICPGMGAPAEPTVRRIVVVLAAVVLCVLAFAPATASAQAPAWTCEASALRGSVLGAAPIEPVTVNRGGAACQSLTATLGQVLPAPLTTVAAAAQTVLKGPAGALDQQSATSVGGVADLRLPVLPDLPIALPPIEIPAELAAVNVPLPTVPLVPLPSALTLDLRPAINALLPGGRLPAADLLRLQGATAYAAAQCESGTPRLVGRSTVSGLTVLGQELPTNQIVEQALTLFDSAGIDPSNIDLSLVPLPPGLSFVDPIVGPILTAAVRSVLDGLPNVAIPPTLAHVKVTPASQVTGPGTLTQRGPRLEVSVAGQSLADLVIGEATVGQRSVSCARAASVPDQLGCTERKLVLVDVFRKGDRVQLFGAADPRFAGRTVNIVYAATGKVVAKTRIAADGSFEDTAPLPPKSLRNTNRSRYRAVLGDERSLNLKLARRMVVTQMSAKDGKVTIAGYVTKPLAEPLEEIVVKRRISCQKNIIVARVKPNSDGTFRVTVDAPSNRDRAVYRLATRVRKFERNPKTFPTFTLPRAVNLR